MFELIAGILLDTTVGALSLSGFDFEVAAQATVDVTIAESGQQAAPGQVEYAVQVPVLDGQCGPFSAVEVQ